MISILESIISILVYIFIIFFPIYLFRKFKMKLPLLIFLFMIFLIITSFIEEYVFNFNDNNWRVSTIISLFFISVVNIIITTLQYKNNQELKLSAIYKILFFYLIINDHNDQKKNKNIIKKILSWVSLPIKLLFANKLTTIKNRKSIYILNLIWIVVFLMSSILFAFDKIEIGCSLYSILAISILIFKIIDKIPEK